MKRYDDSWEQIQVAYKVAPDHSGIARGIDALVNKFMLAGAFAVGTSMDDIKELLGEPNRSVPLGADRVRLLYAHWGVDFKNAKIHEIVNLQGATEALYQPTETISIDLDGRPWRPGLRRKIKDRVVSFWYIKGQGVTDWKEQIVIDRILGGGKFGSPVQIAERQIKDERKIDAQIKSKIWESDESSAMLTLVKTDRGSQQYQLVRIFKGPVDLHRITYTIKSDQPPEQSVLNNWMAIFKSAKLENVKR